MPVDLQNLIRISGNHAYSNKVISDLCSKPIHSAAFMTIVIIVLIMIICPCKKGTSLLIFCRLGFYIFLTSFVIMFMHDGITSANYQKKYESKQSENLIQSFSGGNDIVYGGDNIQIEPMTGDDVHNSSPYIITEANNASDGSNESLFRQFGV